MFLQHLQADPYFSSPFEQHFVNLLPDFEQQSQGGAAVEADVDELLDEEDDVVLDVEDDVLLDVEDDVLLDVEDDTLLGVVVLPVVVDAVEVVKGTAVEIDHSDAQMSHFRVHFPSIQT